MLAHRLPHGVHHSDPDEDLITGAGVHAFESAASMVIRFAAIMMLAVSVVTVAFRGRAERHFDIQAQQGQALWRA